MIRIRLIHYTRLRRSFAAWRNSQPSRLVTVCGVLIYRRAKT